MNQQGFGAVQTPNILEVEATIMLATRVMKDCLKKVVKNNYEPLSDTELKQLENCVGKWNGSFKHMNEKEEDKH